MALQGGLMSVADIDTALSRIFKARFLLGEFDPPSMVPYSSIPDSSVDCQLHRDLALLAAKKAIVLLKNQNAVLPLNKDSINRIAVIGPNANVVQLGGYSGFPVVSVTPLQGIINEFSGPGKTISYSQGCPLYGPVDSNAVKAAVNLAKNADVAIVVCGTDLQLAKEEMDRTSLDLPGIQDTLIQKILEVNPRTIVVLVCGFPLSINRVYEHVPGIVLAWYDGQAQGSAIASVLAGNFNPGGRLSSTWFKSAADLPPMDHYDIKENRTYQYFTGTPLFSFGYGLSYTTFEYSNLVKSKTVLNPADSLLVSLTIKNSGKMAGDEVVQFYVHHDAPPIIRPLKELKGFQRISLQPGESKMVEFYLRNSDLSYYDIKSRSFQVDNGSVDILIGSSSSDIRLADRIQVKGNTLSPTYRLNPLLRFEAEDFELKSKPVEIVACNEGGQSIKVMANNDYVVYKNVDFGSGVTHFDARIELDHGISREGDLEIRLDSIDGQLSGTMKLKSGGNETGYLKYSGLVNGVAGIHDLIIVFRNSGNGFCRMNWFEFRKEVPGGNGNENDVQLFPNPASTQFTLTYNCVENTGFSVDIYSMAGILIKNVHVQAPVTGLNSLAFNTGDLGLEQGMYLVKCTLNGYCKSFKLCVCR
jgi:beta-glucosidase